MTTILESPPQITEIPEQVQKQTVPPTTWTAPPKKHGRRFTAAIVVAVVALVAALTALALTLGGTTTTTTPPVAAPAAAVSYYEGPVGHGTAFALQVPSAVAVQLSPAYAFTDLVQVPKTKQLAPDYAWTDLVPTTTRSASGLQGSPYSEWPSAVTAPVPTEAPHGAASLE